MKSGVFVAMIYSVFLVTEPSFAQESNNADQQALEYADLLGSPDPEIRDKTAYEGLFGLLRERQVSDAGKLALLDKCEGQLKGPAGEGFIRPFAALCIAEVARTDRIEAWFTDEQRVRVTKIGTDYLKSVTDYRGFDEKQGWRHGVAHASDILMQLSLNENVVLTSHMNILDAVATQISPNDHFYIYGEPARLAWPITFIAMQGKVTDEKWAQWFDQFSKPDPQLDEWADAFSSQAGLAKRHNVRAFLSAVYLNASMSDDENIKSLTTHVTTALRKLP